MREPSPPSAARDEQPAHLARVPRPRRDAARPSRAHGDRVPAARAGSSSTPETACSNASSRREATRRQFTAVLEVVAARDRRSPGDDDGLRARHRLEQRRRRSRVGVLAHGQRHDPRRSRRSRMRPNGTSTSSCDVRRQRPELPGVVRRRDDAERALRAAGGRASRSSAKSRRGSAPIETTSCSSVASGSGRKYSVVHAERRRTRPAGHGRRASRAARRPRPSRRRRSCRDGGRRRRRAVARRLREAARGAREARSPRTRPAGCTRPSRPRSASGMPTVSTVEKTTSARLKAREEASTRAKSPE